MTAVVEAVDLFCGAGGLSYGLLKAGVIVRAGLDFDGKCEFPFTENIVGAKFVKEDLSQTRSELVESFYTEQNIRLLAGCAPCQPFSTLSNGTDRQKSKKWPLLNEFTRLVRDVRPDLVTMENVPTLRKQTIFQSFVAELEDLGFFVSHSIVDAFDYGVPQRRKRLVLLASRYAPVRLLSPAELGVERKTVRDVIAHLPEIEAGGTYAEDPLHKARAFSEINLERIRASRPGGTWKDWPESLLLACHKKTTGETFKSVYGRMEWDKPASTMTTQSMNFGTGRYGHPEQDRALSLREMAILQSFPPHYKFAKDAESINFSSIGRLIGNAVPVDLGYAIGFSLMQHARHHGGVNAGSDARPAAGFSGECESERLSV
ncbi:DNA cytosine methyltransferase [Agrobacterium tumefaciens]|nr:DNA cytosine methyltransferase [Agrobacterium tumefaciens]